MNQSIDYEITENCYTYSQSRKKGRQEYSPSMTIPQENMITKAQISELIGIQEIDVHSKEILLDAVNQLYLSYEIVVLESQQKSKELEEQQEELDRMAQVHEQYKKIIQKLQDDLEATHENQLHLIQQFNAKKREYKQDLQHLEQDFHQTRVINQQLTQEINSIQSNSRQTDQLETQMQIQTEQVNYESSKGIGEMKAEIASVRKELGLKPGQDLLKVVKRYNRFNSKMKELIVSLVPAEYFGDRSANFKDLWEVLNNTVSNYMAVLRREQEQKERNNT